MSGLRTTLIAALVALAGSLTASAQHYYTPDFSIGAKGGVTLSKMDFMPSVRQKMTQGMTFGLMARYTEEKLFGLVGELNITQRGWAEDFQGKPFSYSRHLTYIQLPLLTQIRFGWRKAKIFINLGPEAGYMLASNIKSDFNYADLKSVEGFPSGRRTAQLALGIDNRFDYGIAGGAGVELFASPRNSFLLEGRFYYGIGNVFKATRTSDFTASRGLSIEVTLGYFFRII